MYINGLTLYYSPECPYCRKVLAFMTQHHIQLDEKNILDPRIGKELEEVSGQDGFPTLMIGNEALVGSDKIIAYLQQYLHNAA